MQILIPILGFAPQGGYRVLSELANTWLRMGHTCTFLVPATSEPPYYPTEAAILRCDRQGSFTDKQIAMKPTGYDNLMSLWAGLQKIASNYDVVLANHSLTAWPVRWSRCGKAKKFYYIQAYEPHYYPLRTNLIKHLLSRISYIFKLKQISNSVTYQGFGLKPMGVIPPGIDLSIFAQKKCLGTFRTDSVIVLGTIGRAEAYKGTPIVLAAYRRLRQDGFAVRMNVAFGNTPEAEDVTITPIKGDRALAEYYRSVDILVAGCLGQHGAPHYPLIEAMASGTTVVHTGYYPGTKANSWQATCASAEAVAEAIRQAIISPPDVRIAKAGAARKQVEDEMSWDAVASQFLNYFRG